MIDETGAPVPDDSEDPAGRIRSILDGVGGTPGMVTTTSDDSTPGADTPVAGWLLDGDGSRRNLALLAVAVLGVFAVLMGGR
ncbi:hypothetical protein [Haloferax sp. ATB1]|uniref:hypothetical protein n=1 Tax=Haloferax sp. ATB1 TaxID=1508454 RepID=UPI0005B20961|nr:hypothetical protein [Haloferax sp. ATB1]